MVSGRRHPISAQSVQFEREPQRAVQRHEHTRIKRAAPTRARRLRDREDAAAIGHACTLERLLQAKRNLSAEPTKGPAWRLEQIDDGLWRALALSARRSESGPLLGRDHRVVAHWLHLARLRSDRLPLRKRIVPRRAGHLRGLVGVRLIQGFALKQHLGK